MGTPPEAAPARRISPALIVILVIVVLAGLFFLVIQPLLLQQEEEFTFPEPSPRPRATAAPSPAPAPTAPPETFDIFESKDPFRPLVVAGGAPGGTPAPGGTTVPTAGPGAGGAPAPAGGQRVAVLDVFDEGGVTKVQVRVAGTVYTVTAGQVFATNFKVVSVSGNCATLLLGDDKFTLCEGEEIIK